jgi:hypothetical protein
VIRGSRQLSGGGAFYQVRHQVPNIDADGKSVSPIGINHKQGATHGKRKNFA